MSNIEFGFETYISGVKFTTISDSTEHSTEYVQMSVTDYVQVETQPTVDNHTVFATHAGFVKQNKGQCRSISSYIKCNLTTSH